MRSALLTPPGSPTATGYQPSAPALRNTSGSSAACRSPVAKLSVSGLANLACSWMSWGGPAGVNQAQDGGGSVETVEATVPEPSLAAPDQIETTGWGSENGGPQRASRRN